MFRYFRMAILTVILLFSTSAVFAGTQFIVKRIQIQGLQRISASTVMAAIPLHVGQTYSTQTGNAIIAALFRTGFFSNVQLAHRQNTLLVRVVERPTIGSISITGNKSIKSTQLKPVLKNLHIVVGDTYDP